FLLARVKGQKPKELLVGLIVAPVGRIVKVNVMHGVPSTLEPLVLPREYKASGASGIHNVLITFYKILPVFLFVHVALVTAGILVLLSTSASRGYTILRYDYRNIMEFIYGVKVRSVCVESSL